jgi:hydrophobic/amphiphilic exporter-1 (mainly G- bacteria), HAE1 family
MRAGPVRLRPILMTAFSTMAGMVPVAIGLGAGAETRAPMATSIIGGMITSTILTLVVVPVVYSLLDDAGEGLLRLVKIRQPALPPVATALDARREQPTASSPSLAPHQADRFVSP